VEALRNYYGHITRYEEYIYGSDIERLDADVVVTNYPYSATPETNKMYVVAYRRVQDSNITELITHLINFRGVANMNWKTKLQSVPILSKDVEVKVPLPENKGVVVVYLASPDNGDRDPIKLNYNVENGYVQFMVPSLRYWSTIIIKLGGETSTSHTSGIGRNQVNFFRMEKVFVALKDYQRDFEEKR